MELYEIYGTEESADENPKREWRWLAESKSLKTAKTRAIRVSKKYWHEVEIRGSKNSETIHHSYWRKGRMIIDMSV